MFETAKEFIASHHSEDISVDADGYMDAYCDVLDDIAGNASRLKDCTKDEPYDDTLGDKFTTWFVNLHVPFERAWFLVRCVQEANGVSQLLTDVIIPHYSSYEAIPQKYRDRMSRAMSDVTNNMPTA